MEEVSGAEAAAKTWGFRRSTIARREFMEAIGSVDSSPPVPRRRGRGRGRGKRTGEAGGTALAPKRGRGARGHVLLPSLTATDEGPEADEDRATEGVASDRGEDSDDLNLQEIRKRAVARCLQELKHGDTGHVDRTEQGDGTDVVTSGGGVVCSSTDTGRDGISVPAVGVQTAPGGQNGSERQLEEEHPLSGDGSERTGQQTHGDRLMVRCGACREWRPEDCVRSSEACLAQSNGGASVCPSCSDRPDSHISPGPAVGVEEEVKVKEETASPKCTGPGCSNAALPESVYCGHRCIVQHAALAMKSLSEPKAAALNPAAEPALKSEKRSFLAKLFKLKINKTAVQEEHVSKPEDLESVCSETAMDREQPTASSSPAPDPNPTVKEHDIECNPSTPSQPPDLARKHPSPGLIRSSTPGRAKKTMPGSPRLVLLKGALSKRPLTLSKKPCDPTAPAESSNPPELLLGCRDADSPLLIRQNIRHSLSRILLRRLHQSEDLNMPESDVEQLAVALEKEMFNMCYTTDEEYKNKFHGLILSLKDPKNKELCHQVLKGSMPSVRLIHLSQQDLTSVEECTADPSVMDSSSRCSVDPGEAAPPEEETAQSLNTTSTSEEKLKPNAARGTSADIIISSMLKDTTSQHKHHLFDLNCRICTGQVSTDNDPETKKPKMKTVQDETEKQKSSELVHRNDEALAQDSVIESPASPSAEDVESLLPSADFSPVLIPSVPTVSISRRDPRTVQYRQTLLSSAVVSTPLGKAVVEPLPETPYVPVHTPAPMPPKSILMKPSSATLDTSYGSATSLADCDRGTRQFLTKQNILWKGFLNMPTVAKFVTKGYLISGSPDFLKEELPDTIQVGGRILPQTVWEYVDLIKSSEAKELSLIRFHPGSDEEEVAYVSLFSYFNSRRRFGVVSNICKRIKDLYLIPLCTKQSIPAALLPIEGPGLEPDHPNILIGLAVCQKLRRLEGLPQGLGEKKSRPLICMDKKETINPTSLIDLGQHNFKAVDADIFNSNPVVLPDPSCSASTLCGLSVSKPTPSVLVSTDSTPLQTILNTLFGQKKQPSDATECNISLSTDTVQPCQQTCKHGDLMELGDDRPYDPEEYDPAFSNEALVPLSPAEVLEPKVSSAAPDDDDDDDDDDRPYDPEEEYSAVTNAQTLRNNIPKTSESKNLEETSTFTRDIAYDPEDETVFEEMQNYLTSNESPHKSTVSEHKIPHNNDKIPITTLSEQQKILEELNRQIEEQKRQLEEQTESLRLQKEAIGVSMAHFSVSDALMSPPTVFGRDEEEEIEKTFGTIGPFCPIISQNRDPRICRKASQDVQIDDAECKAIAKESAQKLLNMEETKNIVVNKSPIIKKENLASDDAIPKEGSPETAQLQNTKCSRSESSCKKGGGRRSTVSTYRSSRRRSWHEDRHYHQDRASSRTLHTALASKDVSDKHHRSRQSAEHPSRGSYIERKRVTSSRTRHHHHHRDSSSPSQYRSRSRYSMHSHSSQRDKCSQDDSGQSRKTDQQGPGPSSEHSTQSSQHESDQVSGSEGKQSAYTSGQSGTTFKDKHLAEVKGVSINTKHEADQLQTLQNQREDCSQPLLNKSFEKILPFSGQSEIKRFNLPLSKMDSSSNQGPLLLTPCLHSTGKPGPGDTDLPLHRVTPPLHPPTLQTDVLHHDTIDPSSLPPHDRTAHFSEPGWIDQKRGMPSVHGSSFLHNEMDKFNSGDYPKRAFHSQPRHLSQSDTDLLCSGELPQNKRDVFFMHDADYDNQPCVSQKEEGFPTWEQGEFDHQKHPNNILRRFPLEEADQVHQSQRPKPAQLHECNFQDPETRRSSRKKMHNFHNDESVQFQQRESLLGPVPGHKDNFRPPIPSEHFRPSTFHKWKPLGEHPSMRKLRSPKFGPSRGQSSRFEANTHASHQDIGELQTPNCHQTCAEDVEDPIQTRFSRQVPTHSQDPASGATYGQFEGQRYTEIKGQPRGFRGQRRGIRGTFFARGNKINAQMRGTDFDSPQQFLAQREPSPDLHGLRPSSQNCDRFDEHNDAHSSGFPTNPIHFKKTVHQNPCEIQNLAQPRTTFECQLRPTNIRPLRRSSPLLPTPPGGPIDPNTSQVHRHNSYSESNRSQELAEMRRGHVAKDASGLSIREVKPSIGSSFKQQCDNSESLRLEEQRVGYESRPAEPSVRDRSYGHACRRSRGRSGRCRDEKGANMWR